MGACASKPKDLDKERIPPVAPATPKASETKKKEPSDSAADVAAAADLVPEGETPSEKEETAKPAEEPAEAIKEEEEKTISEVVVDKTRTTQEEIKTEVTVVEAH